MAYFDVYKNKLKAKGGSSGSSMKESGLEFIKRNFKDDPSYRQGTIIFNDKFEEVDIDIRIENVDASADEKKIIVFHDERLSLGNYVKYDHLTFLVEEIERNLMTPVLKCQRCNQVLQWSGLDTPMPCYITNDAYGSKILTDNSYLSNTDTKAKILVQDNEYTRKIKRDWRFIFNNSEFDIFKVIDINRSMSTGIITLITKKDKLMVEDDLENNIAFNEEFLSNVFIVKGQETIKINNSYTYTTDAKVSKWQIDDTSIATISSSTNNSCEITAITSDEYFILNGMDTKGNILCSKYIATTR